MSQSPFGRGVGPRAGEDPEFSADRRRTIVEALTDEDCRRILAATSDEALSANEISERCDLPRSTTYRKLEKLTDVDLLGERIRICRSGKNPSEYVRLVDEVTVGLDESGGISLDVTAREPPERSLPFAVSAD